MQRFHLQARPNWEERLREVGFIWYTPTPEHPVPYWSEEAYYSFTSNEIDQIKQDSQELTNIILEATNYAIEKERLPDLGIPAYLHRPIQESWDQDDPTIYMRLDLAYDGSNRPKLLEVNAQTPTSLLEAAVCQWQWLEDQQARGQLNTKTTQWNTIHEGLLEQWQHLVQQRGVQNIHFCSADNSEDYATVTYLRELANQANAKTQFILAEQIGSSVHQKYLIDLANTPIQYLMWLWPFEYAWDSKDSSFLASTRTQFIEPLWKAVTSSKGLLALIHELYPKHELILPTTLHAGALGPNVVKKPLYSREGQNVTLPGQQSTPGEYSDFPLIEQEYTTLPTFEANDGPRYPVLGVWVAGDEVCGLGIREGRSRVTDNRATFVPHVISD